MPLTKVLVTVKTYPTLSGKYDELVCTAGFREDGTWIRIYPVPFRQKSEKEQYSKYEWIEVDLVKNTTDFRPESFRPRSNNSEIKILEKIDTKDHWAKRKEYVLGKVYYNLAELIKEAKDKRIRTSLAVFKPSEILGFEIESTSKEWDKVKLAKINAERMQTTLYKQREDLFEIVKKLPFKFYYKFKDNVGKVSRMMIEDWEIGALYWNSLKKHEGNETKAKADVKKKYYDDFAKTKDLYLFLGTTQQHHYRAKNPFIIIGTFHPTKPLQDSLF